MKSIDFINTEWLQPFTKNIKIFLDELTTNEPVISQKVNRSGKVVWHVYDPRTNDLVEFDTEDQMISWLDGHIGK
jgi:hypothetical protein